MEKLWGHWLSVEVLDAPCGRLEQVLADKVVPVRQTTWVGPWNRTEAAPNLARNVQVSLGHARRGRLVHLRAISVCHHKQQ